MTYTDLRRLSEHRGTHKKDKVEKLDIPATATAVKFPKNRINELCRFRRHPVFSHA